MFFHHHMIGFILIFTNFILIQSFKGIVFFFPVKVHGPFNQSNRKIVYFFFRVNGVFFLSQKKFMSHSFRIWWIFLFFFESGMCTFPHILGCFLFVFFSCKSSRVIHSFDLISVFLITSLAKKISFFIHSFDLPQKVHKNELFQEKKIRYLCPTLF